MKKFFIAVVLLGAVMFFTNPTEESFYQAALKEEVGMGDKWFTEAKHEAMAAVFEYENFYVCGMMKGRIEGKSVYIGAFNQVFKIR